MPQPDSAVVAPTPAESVRYVLPLPPDAVLLHVGPHKTGTTAVQAALAAARPRLAEHRVTYPGRDAAQHAAALALLGRTWGWSQGSDRPANRRPLRRLVRQVRRARGRVVVSSEFLCAATAEQAREAVSLLGGDRVHALVGARPLADVLPSAWQQTLKYGRRMPYHQWLREVLDGEGDGRAASFWRRQDLGHVVGTWAQAVTPKRVTVVVLDGLPRTALPTVVEQLLDLPAGLLTAGPAERTNRSMTREESELLLAVNRLVRPWITWPDYERLVRRGAVLRMVEDRVPGPDEDRLRTPRWARQRAEEIGAQTVSGLRESGVTVVGDLSRLARPASVGASPPRPRPDAVEIEAAAEAVVGAVRAAGLDRLGTADLVREILRRTGRALRPGSRPRT